MYLGQTIAIPVLDRHITHSQGICQQTGEDLSPNCVMADALRDRFPGSTVSVGNSSAEVLLPDGTGLYLKAKSDMSAVISAFDSEYNIVSNEPGSWLTLKGFISRIREAAKAPVHATVERIDQPYQ